MHRGSGQIACDSLPPRLLPIPRKPLLSQSGQMLPIRQQPVEPHLLPPRSRATGVLLPLPRSSRLPNRGAAQYWWAFPSSPRARQSRPFSLPVLCWQAAFALALTAVDAAFLSPRPRRRKGQPPSSAARRPGASRRCCFVRPPS